MTFNKKYVTELTDDYYIWFGEYDGKIHYGVDKNPENNIPVECDFMYISDNNIGVYDDVMYIHFGGSIYKADEKALSVTQVTNGIYNVYFLEECIAAMKKKPDRLDEMIKIIPADDTIISIGTMQKENVLR